MQEYTTLHRTFNLITLYKEAENFSKVSMFLLLLLLLHPSIFNKKALILYFMVDLGIVLVIDSCIHLLLIGWVVLSLSPYMSAKHCRVFSPLHGSYAKSVTDRKDINQKAAKHSIDHSSLWILNFSIKLHQSMRVPTCHIFPSCLKSYQTWREICSRRKRWP